MEFYAYVVLCSDQSIYTGHADNLEVRLAAHNDGRFRGYTVERRPVRLIFQAAFPTRGEAIQAERQIKGWSRAKKLALADGDWEFLQRLSLRRQPQPKIANRSVIGAVRGSRTSPRTGRNHPLSESACLKCPTSLRYD